MRRRMVRTRSDFAAAVLTALLIATALVLSATAHGHIKNEASQFPDIEFSDARFDIVMLVGAGIIPETPVFEPDKALSRRELATWVALARKLGPGGETPDTDALADAAMEAGIVDSLEGDATLGDLNTLFFRGEAQVDDPSAVPTKAEAASFIASRFDTDAGRALLESRGLALGRTGVVTTVGTQEGHHGNVYVVTIGGTTTPLDAHGRVANGPTDLLQWEGRNVRRSFVQTRDDSTVFTYLEAEPPEAAAPAAEASAAEPTAAAASGAPAGAAPPGATPGEEAAEPVDRRLLLGLFAAVVVLGFVLFFRRRRQG